MNRWVGVLIVVVLLAVGFAAYARPDLMPGNFNMPGLVWAIMALMLVTGAGYGFQRVRHDGGMALAGILFWAVLIVAITLAYSALS